MDYYTKGKEQYYLGGIDKKGYWFGDGAARLGLLGKKVHPEVFRNLLEGFSPDGKFRLVQNAGHTKRQRFWDATFNDPKAFSVLWAMVPEESRGVLHAANRRALERTLREFEANAGITRRGKGGQTEEKAGLVFAVFHEGSSRALDPHSHWHAVVVNLAVREDGTTGALHSIRFFRQKKRLGKLYRDNLAAELRDLGLTIEPEKHGFHIAGVPRDLCALFSKRRKQIERWMAEHHEKDAVSAKHANLVTRPSKRDVPLSELFAHWQRIGEAHGWGATQAQNLLSQEYKQTNSQQQSAANAQRNPSDSEQEQSADTGRATVLLKGQ